MVCTECGAGEASPVRVEYADGTRETLRLCAACRREFGEGDLVTDVRPIEGE